MSATAIVGLEDADCAFKKFEKKSKNKKVRSAELKFEVVFIISVFLRVCFCLNLMVQIFIIHLTEFYGYNDKKIIY